MKTRRLQTLPSLQLCRVFSLTDHTLSILKVIAVFLSIPTYTCFGSVFNPEFTISRILQLLSILPDAQKIIFKNCIERRQNLMCPLCCHDSSSCSAALCGRGVDHTHSSLVPSMPRPLSSLAQTGSTCSTECPHMPELGDTQCHTFLSFPPISLSLLSVSLSPSSPPL